MYTHTHAHLEVKDFCVPRKEATNSAIRIRQASEEETAEKERERERDKAHYQRKSERERHGPRASSSCG